MRNQQGTPETPIIRRGNSSHSLGYLGAVPEPKNSFWNRSPIAKGVKDAIWSRRIGTPTRGGAPPTPTRNELQGRRPFIGVPPSTPTSTRLSAQLPATPRLEVPAARRSLSHFSLPATPTRPELHPARRAATPTRLDIMGRRVPTPTRAEQGPRRSTSPSGSVPRKTNSEESHSESRRSSLRSRSESFGTAQGSIEEEDYFEFRAQRIGKLGLVINSSPQTGPMVEQVKDYSTLFGRINAGDRIVEVDGVETSHMSTKDVTKRLAGKYGIRSATGDVRIKVARIREREWNDDEQDERRSVKSNISAGGSVDSFYSYHRRNHSDPEQFLDRSSLNSVNEQRLSEPLFLDRSSLDSLPRHRLSSRSHSMGNDRRAGEEV